MSPLQVYIVVYYSNRGEKYKTRAYSCLIQQKYLGELNQGLRNTLCGTACSSFKVVCVSLHQTTQLPSGVAWQRIDENEERNEHHPTFLVLFMLINCFILLKLDSYLINF
jgi:hypothetical protein